MKTATVAITTSPSPSPRGSITSTAGRLWPSPVSAPPSLRATCTGYQDVLKAVSDSVLTNMPQQDILKLVKLQLEDKVDWDISTYTLSGTTDMQDCFTTGFPLSVLVPDESSVATARRMIRELING